MGLNNWQSLDFANTLTVIVQHNWYVLVMVEQLSKYIKLVPLLDKFSGGTTFNAFLDWMFKSLGY
jgi:hypothetical protein